MELHPLRKRRSQTWLRATLVVLALSASTLLGACGASSRRPPPFDARVGASEAGLASYYADGLKGRPTASGEPYDPQAFTAAHRSIPLGSVVRVWRPDGRSVEVRINDRGPFGSRERVLDLSRAAAERLGLVRAGIARVRLEVLRLAPSKRRAP